jgi:hypothetical protein
MRIGRIAVAAGMLASALALSGCYYGDGPGRWGDHHHRHHHGHHGGHHHDGHRR